MHVCAKLFQLLLVLDAEVLLLVHDHETEVAETDLFRKYGVGADDHFDLPVGETFAGFGSFLGRHQA